MLGTIARVALMRVVPKRLVPLLAAWQVIQMVRSVRRRPADREATRVDDTARRTRRR